MRDDRKGLTIDERSDMPRTFQAFTQRFPEVAAAHEAIGKAGDAAGPLDRKTIELIKLGMCVASGLESATRSHARRALQHGASREEVEQAIALAVNPCGLPRTVMAWQWATEQMDQEESS
jgi:4-carboxymuconolactone decarboxylase